MICGQKPRRHAITCSITVVHMQGGRSPGSHILHCAARRMMQITCTGSCTASPRKGCTRSAGQVLRRGGMPCANSHRIRGACAPHGSRARAAGEARLAQHNKMSGARSPTTDPPRRPRVLQVFIFLLPDISETTQICSMIRATGEGATRAPACTRCARARERALRSFDFFR